jgi:hypothetical protein
MAVQHQISLSNANNNCQVTLQFRWGMLRNGMEPKVWGVGKN